MCFLHWKSGPSKANKHSHLKTTEEHEEKLPSDPSLNPHIQVHIINIMFTLNWKHLSSPTNLAIYVLFLFYCIFILNLICIVLLCLYLIIHICTHDK